MKAPSFPAAEFETVPAYLCEALEPVVRRVVRQELVRTQPDELLDVHQAAKVLGVAPRTVYSYRRLGQLEAVKVNGRSYRFRRTELDGFIERGRAGNRPRPSPN